MPFPEEVLRALLALAILILPGFAITARGLSHLPPRERVMLALALGVAAAIYFGFLLTQIHFYLALVIFGIGALAALLVVSHAFVVSHVAKRSGGATQNSGTPPRTLRAGLRTTFRAMLQPHTLWLLAIVMGATALRLYPLLCSDYPSGTDTAFHLILAQKIILTGHFPTDWTPFENIAVNYTLGGHLLVALVSEIAGIPLQRAFSFVMVALQGISVALIYVVAKAVFQRESIALWSSFAYGFVALNGGLDYYRWGGLPTLTGMTMLVTSIALALLQRTRVTLALASFVLAALYLAHHHSMVVTFVVYGACMVALWLFHHRGLARRMFAIVALSGVLGVFWLVPYALRVGKIGETLATGFWIFFIRPWEIPFEVGLAYSVLIGPGLVGLLLAWKKSRGENLLAWGAWTVALLGAFVAGEYGYRAITKLLTGTAVVVFTPAHFLNDAAYPFALAAGWTLERASAGLARFEKSGKALIATGTLALAIGVGGATMQSQCWVVIKPDEMALYDWIRTHTPSDALILENPYWLNYATWREASLTPLPVTEPVTSPSVVYKQEVLGKRNWGAIAKWQKQTGRAVYLVTREETLTRAEWQPVFEAGRWRVYLSNP